MYEQAWEAAGSALQLFSLGEFCVYLCKQGSENEFEITKGKQKRERTWEFRFANDEKMGGHAGETDNARFFQQRLWRARAVWAG